MSIKTYPRGQGPAASVVAAATLAVIPLILIFLAAQKQMIHPRCGPG